MSQSQPIRAKLNLLLSHRSATLLSKRKELSTLETNKKKLSATVEAQALLQKLAQETQQHVHRQIAGVVSRCLVFVLGPEYGFHIEFLRQRGKTIARAVILLNGHEMDPEEDTAGGALDITAFGLRVAAVMLHRPALRPLLVLDEPFKWVSAEYRLRVRELVETLAEELGVQFVIVTHIEELQIGKVVRL